MANSGDEMGKGISLRNPMQGWALPSSAIRLSTRLDLKRVLLSTGNEIRMLPPLPLPYGGSLGFVDLPEKEAFALLGLLLLRDIKTGKYTSVLWLSLSVGHWASLTSPR